MELDFISLAVIALAAAVCPLLAKAVPHKLLPETVLLLLAGALLGPYLAGAIHLTESVALLADLGLAFLFLLAGFEIEPQSLAGKSGRRGLATWLITLGLAFAAVRLSPDFSVSHTDGIAVAIALTTTALGTLLPILKERKLTDSPVGNATLSYGTWGELGPVLAMALLLSTRSHWLTVAILVAFAAIAVAAAIIPARYKKEGHALARFFDDNAHTTSQTRVRFTMLVLVGLVAISAVFELDIVLGAFAAGFVLHHIIPEGNRKLEMKLDGMAYGFFIPLFFIVSGAKINLMAVFDQPLLLAAFIGMLLVIRALPVFVAVSTGAETRGMALSERVSVALYCTTALPIIVAVTTVAVSSGAMPQSTASVLVAAGAITVFLMPLLATVVSSLGAKKG